MSFNLLNRDQFITEKKKAEKEEEESVPALKAGEIISSEDGEKSPDTDDLPVSATAVADNTDTKSKKDKKDKGESHSSGSGATSGDSDVRSPTSTDVRSPTSTRTEVRSPTSTETSTDAYTSGNVTVTGGAGDGANTVVHIHAAPEDYKRLPSGKGRKKHMPSAVAMSGPNDKKSY